VQPDSNSPQVPDVIVSQPHSKGLLTIGLFKLMKALVFFSIGMGALHFINADLDYSVQRAVKTFKFDTEGHFVSILMDKVDMVDDSQLKKVSEGTFAYAGVAVVEGVGLLLEQTWAEYLTLILSLSFLPWELYEMIRRSSPWYLGIIGINLAIVVYLLWFLRDLHAKQRVNTGSLAA
jgi:uncharacterized membrane protein (DUF2068 family)